MNKNIYDDLPSKDLLKETYDTYTPYFFAILQNIQKILEKNIVLSSSPTYKARIKSFDSYYKKILRQKILSNNKLISLTDIMGIRIICSFLEDIDVVIDQVKDLFDVTEVEQKGAKKNFKEFEYESVHILIKIPDKCIPQEKDFNIASLPENAVCEIQIRTILQDAWAEVEHELVYKSEFSPFDLPLRRKLASINASLTLADTIFQEIRDYQKKLQGEVNERRKLFYEKVDELDKIKLEVDEFTKEKVIHVSPYIKGTIDDLILDAISAHNEGDLKTAIKIYTQILSSEPSLSNIVLSVIHKHRGMAYFTDSEYEKALSDFKESTFFDKNNFRAFYYQGIVYSILQNHKMAIECFSKSLEINEFQAHTFYHRSYSYYEVGEYEKALSDINATKKLGMHDDCVKVLAKKIADKI